MSFIYNYFFGETTQEVIIPSKETLHSRYKLLLEIHNFDKSLLKTYKSPIKKKKLYKFKKQVKKAPLKKPHEIPLP